LTEDFVEGQLIKTIDSSVVDEIKALSQERESLLKKQEKLNQEKEQKIRGAHKFIEHLLVSRNVQCDHSNEGLGIYNGDVLYITTLDRLSENPTAEPKPDDKIKGNMTKSEKRKYKELLNSNDYFNKKLHDFNEEVLQNEKSLERVEKSITDNVDMNLDSSKHCIFISTQNYNVYVVEIPTEELNYGEHGTH
jgi:hypothetical protein